MRLDEFSDAVQAQFAILHDPFSVQFETVRRRFLRVITADVPGRKFPNVCKNVNFIRCFSDTKVFLVLFRGAEPHAQPIIGSLA